MGVVAPRTQEGESQPSEAPARKGVRISFEKYVSIAKMVAVHIREKTADATSDDAGVRMSELINWYLSGLDLQNQEDTENMLKVQPCRDCWACCCLCAVRVQRTRASDGDEATIRSLTSGGVCRRDGGQLIKLVLKRLTREGVLIEIDHSEDPLLTVHPNYVTEQ